MRRSVTALCLAALASPLTASERMAVEIGRGTHNNRGSDALFLRYAYELRESLLPGQNFYEWSFGTWDGQARNNAAGFALGTRGRWERFHLDGGIGVAYLEDKTPLSGTHQQFSVRLGAGVVYERIDVSLYLTHYSNAKLVFGWDGPNSGYDFITVQIGYALK
jgi:hypothetical protein